MRKLKTIATRLFGVVMAAAFALSVPLNAMADNSSIITVGNETYTIGSYSGTNPDSNAIWRSVDTYYNTENKYTPSFHTLTNSSGEQWPVFCIQLGSDGPVATSTAGQNYTAYDSSNDGIENEDIQNSILARYVSYKVIENGFYSTEYWKKVGLNVNGTTYTYTDDQVRTATQLAIWIAESVVGGGNFYLYYDDDGNCYAPSSIQSAMGTGSDYVVMEKDAIDKSELPTFYDSRIDFFINS
jgi:TQXA domain-containing protein